MQGGNCPADCSNYEGVKFIQRGACNHHEMHPITDNDDIQGPKVGSPDSAKKAPERSPTKSPVACLNASFGNLLHGGSKGPLVEQVEKGNGSPSKRVRFESETKDVDQDSRLPSR